MLFNKVQQVVAFFFFFGCCQRPSHRGGRAVEEIERETCKERVREREREKREVERERVSRIKLFGFRNKYGMY